MVISLGAGTHVFQLDRSLGEFVLKTRSIKMPKRGTTRWNETLPATDTVPLNATTYFLGTLAMRPTRGFWSRKGAAQCTWVFRVVAATTEKFY